MTWHVLTTDFPPRDGGIATWADRVAGALHAAGDPVVVHARAPIGPAPYPVVRMWGRSWARHAPIWAAASLLPRLRRGDAVLAATWPLATKILGRARALDVPVIVAYHGSDLTRPPVVPGLDAVRRGAVHAPVSAYLGGLLGAPHTVLPCPIALEDPVPRGDRLLAIARLGPLKGVDRALRLARRLGRPITVVGDGPERPALESLARDLAVDVTFTGAIPRHAIPWAGTWAALLLSRADTDGSGQEGLGLVLLEAAARGIPGIGSAVGGIPEAATVVLADPDRDPIPDLPGPAVVRAAFAARHGPARVVAALRGLARHPQGSRTV